MEFVQALARFSRVLWFDMRGVGMSSPVVGDVPIESWMDDLVAVMDAEGSRRATLFAQGHAAQMAVMAAATHPERVTSLVLAERIRPVRPRRRLPSRDATARPGRSTRITWRRTGGTARWRTPSVRRSPTGPVIVDWWGRVERYGATPVRARARLESVLELDVRDVLPLVEVPTLVDPQPRQRLRARRSRPLPRRAHPRRAARRARQRRPLANARAGSRSATIEEFVTGSRRRRRTSIACSRRCSSSTSSARPSG